jgi:hypothetical protein
VLQGVSALLELLHSLNYSTLQAKHEDWKGDNLSEKAPRTEVLEFTQPAVAATVSDTSIVGEAPYAATVTSVSYVPDASVTGAASPASRTLRVVNRGSAGSGTTEVASLALVGGVNLTAGDEKAITLSATPANLTLAAGDVLAFESNAVGGTGLADPGGLVQIELSRS